ncbi:hypothetical protein ACFL1L_05185 [Thermoplasmatota archaeon]
MIKPGFAKNVRIKLLIIVGIIIINYKKIIKIIMGETRRCSFCDHKFIVDELDPEYKCKSCRKNNVTSYINTK